jgi:hypothetical protein
MAVGRNELPGATVAERDGVRRLAAASLLLLVEQQAQLPPGGVGTVEEMIVWAEQYVSLNPNGPPPGADWQPATQQLDELLKALGLPDHWALFDAIGRDELPGATIEERAAVRHAAATTLLAAYQANRIPLPAGEATPEALIRAAEAEATAHQL